MNVYPGFSRLKVGARLAERNLPESIMDLLPIAEWSEEVNSNLGNQFFVRLHCFILSIFQLHFSQLVFGIDLLC